MLAKSACCGYAFLASNAVCRRQLRAHGASKRRCALPPAALPAGITVPLYARVPAKSCLLRTLAAAHTRGSNRNENKAKMTWPSGENNGAAHGVISIGQLAIGEETRKPK